MAVGTFSSPSGQLRANARLVAHRPTVSRPTPAPRRIGGSPLRPVIAPAPVVREVVAPPAPAGSKLYHVAKRTTDVVVSAGMLVALTPLFAVVAALVKLTSRGPVFFAQWRVGKDGREFRFFKFRSMVVDAEAKKAALLHWNDHQDSVTFKMKKDPRITRIGRLIRKTSIDELPQLWNVLKGDMSLVGPRPAVPGEVAQYTAHQWKRLAVVPGLTCTWQVSGRGDLPFDIQVDLDLDYARRRSWLFDLQLLLKTIPAVLTGRGAH